MQAETAQQTEYKGLFTLETPVEIWTPDGHYKASRQIDTKKTPVGTILPQVTIEARKMQPSQRPMTSGEWYRIREYLRNKNPDMEENMITGAYERTSTISDYVHGKKKKAYFDGLLIQIPVSDDEGNLVTDERGILEARHVWEMALPVKSDYAKNMPPELVVFLNTIYGMEDARKRLPDCAYIYVVPQGLKNLFRGAGARLAARDRRVDVSGHLGPLDPNERVASRTAAEGMFIHELNNIDYRAAIELLEKTKDAPARHIETSIESIKKILSNATMRQEEI